MKAKSGRFKAFTGIKQHHIDLENLFIEMAFNNQEGFISIINATVMPQSRW